MALAVTTTVAVAMLGLTLDLGRSYIIKNEIQTFTDSAAFAAAFELDGTNAGILRAEAVGGTGPTSGGAALNRYDFGTKAITGAQVAFSRAYNGPYQDSGSAPADSRFVQVSVTGSAPLYFLPILPDVGSSLNLRGSAIAGQAVEASIGDGLAPFSPDAHNPTDPNFGFTTGQQYTLKWPPLGQRDKPGNACAGDAGFAPPNSSPDRGYIDVGQGNGNAGLHDAIVNNQFNLPQLYTVGSVITWVPGNKNVKPGVDERFAQDTDTVSAVYSAYSGNGRRILIVPVNDGADPALVAGFAAFFIPPGMCGPKNTSPCCAEYMGPGLSTSNHKGSGGGASGGGSGAGLYRVKLFR